MLLYWLGAAVIALTALRQGFKEAAYIWVCCALPAVAIAAMGEPAPFVVISGSLLAAAVLKASNSWPYALTTISIICLIFGGLNIALEPVWLVQMYELTSEMFSQIQQSFEETNQDMTLLIPSLNQIVAIFSLVTALGVTISLMMGRAMQAALDKPGGFRNEFHQLRMPSGLAAILALAALAVGLIFETAGIWATLLALPLFFSGLALVHYAVSKRSSGGFLFIVYLFVVLVSPAKYIIVALGFIDSWVDLRQRVKPQP